jgi:hypothetical protein
MYLIYVDESGDPGMVGSPAHYFILSGLVVHELRWLSMLGAIVAFRRHLASAARSLVSGSRMSTSNTPAAALYPRDGCPGAGRGDQKSQPGIQAEKRAGRG